jgi:hypothetical protein
MPEMRMNSLKSLAINCGPLSEITRGLTPGKDWLFDLSKDPGEQNNVANQFLEIVSDLDTGLVTYAKPSRRRRMMANVRADPGRTQPRGCVSPAPQLKREWSPWPKFGWIAANLRDCDDISDSNLTCPARQSGLCGPSQVCTAPASGGVVPARPDWPASGERGLACCKWPMICP